MLPNLKKLPKLSKKASCVVFRYPRHSHTAPILARFGMNPLSTRLSIKLFTLVFRCISGRTSYLLSDLFSLRSSLPTARLTRLEVNDGLILPLFTCRFGFYSPSYLAANGWNVAPAVRTATSPYHFRAELHRLLGCPVRRP